MNAPNHRVSGVEARRQLYALLDEGLTTRQLLRRVLDIGAAYLGVDHGHIVDIDEEENQWEVAGSTDPPDGPYPEGLRVNLEDTYCRRTIQRAEPIALHDAKEQGWEDDHAYRLHELDTYLGIRIETEGKPFGTICFVSNEARAEPFTEAELIFVEIAGEILGQALSRSQYRQQIENRDRVIDVLNRVLRHNLRNELNVVAGYADLLASECEEMDRNYAERIVTRTDRLLKLGEKARKLDTMTRTVPVPRPTDVVPLITRVAEEFDEEHAVVNVDVQTPETAWALAAPELTNAVRELLDNVARHAGEYPSVSVSVTTESGDTHVTIRDDGPGLPDDERRVLTGGYETPLEHGSGLGLFLVYWIVSMLEGEIDVDASDDGTAIDLRLSAAGQIE